MTLTLADLGEFGALSTLLSTHDSNSGLGDDCYHLQFGNGWLVITADPGPTPLISLLGGDWHDMSVWGWYAATANASDLATSGAAPLFMTNCVFAQPDMPVSDLNLYFNGYNAALNEFGFINAGGDLSSGSRFRSVCTAVGWITDKAPLGRSGCSPEDIVACVGTCGLFASAFLRAYRLPRKQLEEGIGRILTRPIPRIKEMQTLRKVGKITAASDASDGLLGGIWNIAERSNCAFELTLEDEMLHTLVRQEAEILQIDPWNLFSFWGDWQVVITFPESELTRLAEAARDTQMPFVVLGRARIGPPELRAKLGGKRHSVEVVRNEHFSATSYYSANASTIVQMMTRPVFVQS